MSTDHSMTALSSMVCAEATATQLPTSELIRLWAPILWCTDLSQGRCDTLRCLPSTKLLGPSSKSCYLSVARQNARHTSFRLSLPANYWYTIIAIFKMGIQRLCKGYGTCASVFSGKLCCIQITPFRVILCLSLSLFTLLFPCLKLLYNCKP